jgi:DNA-binding transcriptional MerR regulator
MSGQDTGLTSAQMCRAAGVTYRQLDYWCREGLVRPAVEASGQGSRRRWSRADVGAVTALGAASTRRRLPLAELVDA